MGTYIRHILALLRRNLVFRKRAWISSIIQLVLPALMIVILLLVKNSLKDNDTFKPTTIAAVYPTDSVKPLSFLDYTKVIGSEKKCINATIQFGNSPEWTMSGMDMYYNQVPFVKCNPGRCKDLKDKNDASKLCAVSILALAPTEVGDETRMLKLKDYILSTYPHISNYTKYDVVQTFKDRDAINDYVASKDYGVINEDETVVKPKIALAVLIGGSEKEYEYAIRTNSTGWNNGWDTGRPVMPTQPLTKIEFNTFAKKADEACPLEDGTVDIGADENNCARQYMYNGALTIQRLVGDFIHYDSGATDSGYTIAEGGVSFADYPSKEYVQDGFYAVVAEFVPLLLVLGLLFPFSSMLRSMVQEKELRQKELMKMMSISESAIELSWLISLYGFSFFSGLLLTVVSNSFYENASVAPLFVFWQLAFLSFVIFSMFISALFDKTTRATLVGIMIFFGGYFSTQAAKLDTGSTGMISLLSLHPVTALSYALQIIGSLEDAGVGLRTTTLTYSDFENGYNFVGAISGFISSCIYFGLLTWYINRVFPGKYGKALKWNFLFTSSYWCPSRYVTIENLNDWESAPMYEGIKKEDPSAALKQQQAEGTGVHIRGLTKRFGDKAAVDGLELSMYEGQVFALLGHNGAGKTTTINMLTGMLEATSGYAIIDGKSINTQMPEIRENLGICLQHDCLFEQLTVKEHLQFFARVKGLYARKSVAEAEESIDNSIKDVALFEKRNTFSKDLSGGMKRKLSLAIAFSGDSKVVFLDEPTSGMDPFSRRFTWNVIRQNRQDRCIILTTHFMDEADLLGDRIGIMSDGQLRCVGSSLFLKKEFGVGYQITIEKKSKDPSVDEAVKDIVMQSVPEATVLSNVSSELSFQLPLDAASSFVSMFADLDDVVERKDIHNYGVSITTLEEVFLMVARGEVGKERQHLASSRKLGAAPENLSGGNISHRSAEDLSDSKIFTRHVQSLLQKRATNFKRDKKAWVCSTILPVMFTLAGFVLTKTSNQFKPLEPLELRLSNYNPEFDGKGNQNPIPFNKAQSFACQPGKCIADFPNPNPDFFCGTFVSISDSTCNNIDASIIASTLDNDGLLIVDQNVSSVEEASIQLPLNNEVLNIPSSQYGSYYFTHTADSVIDQDNIAYNTMVASLCEVNKPYFTTNDFNCSRFSGLGMVISTNFTALHASLLYQGVADEAIMKAAVGNDHSIKMTIDPLPYTLVETQITESGDAFTLWFFLVLSFPFITGAFATFIVQEKSSKAKHLQTVAGVKPVSYWLSSYIWDVCNYQFPLWITVALMFAFDITAITTSDNDRNISTILLLIFFGPAAAGFTYLVTFFFKSASSCNLFVIVFNFFIGLAGPMVCLILRIIGITTTVRGGESNLENIAVIVEWCCRIVPSFSFAKGILFTMNIGIFQAATQNPDISALSSDVMLLDLIVLVVQSVVYVCLAIAIDIMFTNQKINFGRKPKDNITGDEENIDEDVAAETDRILSAEGDDDEIVLSELKKVYPNGKVAVDGLSFGIPSGQCFGLLGINGAGKTTTMAMLTAEFPPSSGDATLSGFSITTQPEETRRRIGYCPQFDAHFDNMTGCEHVELYAAIKGVPRELVEDAVGAKLRQVGLSEIDSKRLSSNYSGGMKRKLSVACATIGDPKIVFLDEPSTGMDPVSRRDLWTVISSMVSGATKTSVILTTHSMEECEALCPRIGIMAGGKMKCIGSAQHLKTRYGQGYQMELKLEEPTQDDTDFMNALDGLIQNAGRSTTGDGVNADEVFFNMADTISAVDALSSDKFLSSKITMDDPTGYFVHKSASSNVGVTATELAAFCTTELRLRSLCSFLEEKFPDIILREREDTRMRFEVPSVGRKISSLFQDIEENKEILFVSEYGISQTTLEQVFNMHAAVAEQAKAGTNDR